MTIFFENAIYLASLSHSLQTDYKLSEGKIGRDISIEFAKLQGSYNDAIQSRDAAEEQLEKEIKDQRLTKWELDHLVRRSKDYERQTEKLQLEIAALRSHLPMISEKSLLKILHEILQWCTLKKKVCSSAPWL